ncbi:inorganic phosphate transporter [Muricauda sp. CAU 1633]|uniref:inorganic phosphate transporter n=1 Tax=Allomuricauda sp. CAU 1633 TaxID=2816036 RepID=UPI001A8F22AA|nr:inorganic phosphate transporter [Muricauda sp. CAU 1633]MBO0320796.1 inorganic phosphate transporter [Muricauda sp. CAU 1633]
MDNIYLVIMVALAVLAITDLVVGVSNDAVNFLNSALGSKAISFKTIMVVASIGIALGAMSSSGMMEVARKGIFNPSEFVFAEIMIIFMAVMITDVLLLDFFNTLGMPTSTTVSIVFELLGAAVAMALIKVSGTGGGFEALGSYINTDKATEIILGILLSVVIAFSIGAIVQFFSRLLISFRFNEQPKWIGSVFGGLAITAIIHFILVKGLKSANLFDGALTEVANTQPELFLLGNFIFWMIVSLVLTSTFKLNIYKIIITLGTFALAMAFAGNDLVNFIGVPIAAWQSFQDWQASGIAASEYSMGGLAAAVQTPTYLLLISGLVMIITLWLSTKARYVTETEINLAREGEGEERFQPNFLSRQIVKFSMTAFDSLSNTVPNGFRSRVSGRLTKPNQYIPKGKVQDMPAFDMVRASVNLMVASVLISVATSMKLPLSTTYVTFMVAMGSSLADRAWGSESAVYRVAGVLNVIGGWFFTAICAFVAAATIAYLLHIGGFVALILLLVFAGVLLVRNYLSHTRKKVENKVDDILRKAESSSIQGVIEESATNIASVIKRSNKIYTGAINGLAKHDLEALKKNNKGVKKLSKEVDGLKNNVYYFIKNLDESSVGGASNFYITLLGVLQDFTQSLEYISKVSYTHVRNNHKKLKYNQIKELKDLDHLLEDLFHKTDETFSQKSFDNIARILDNKDQYFDLISEKMEKQVARTRTEETSPKNTTLYFSLLTESKDMVKATIKLLELYYSEHDSTVEPARIEK